MKETPNRQPFSNARPVVLEIEGEENEWRLTSSDTRFGIGRLRPRVESTLPRPSIASSAQPHGDGVMVTTVITNAGSSPVRLNRVVVCEADITVGVDPRCHSVYRNGHQSWSGTRTFRVGESDRDMPTSLLRRTTTDPRHRSPSAAGHVRSDIFTTVTELASTDSLSIGFLDGASCFGYVEVEHNDDGTTRLRAWADLDDIELHPGSSFDVPALYIEARSGPGSASSVTEAFIRTMGTHCDALADARHPGGWCSWYYYFQHVTEQDVRQNLETLADLAEQGTALPCDYLMIDDGHQRAIGDWLDTAATFPSGMGVLAADITAKGFDAGIWLAPFLVAPNSTTAHEHPEWILRNARGHRVTALINPAWGARPMWALDTTHPGVLEHLETVAGTIVDEWGYSILKLDFLFAAALVGERHVGVTRARALRMGLDAIRRGAGEDTFLLACGCPLGPAIGVADGMRIGADVTPYWTNRLAKIAQRDLHGLLTRHAIRNTLTRSLLDGLWWANDPDCLMVRSDKTELSIEEIHSLCTVIGMSNGMLVLSDNVARLPGDRRELVQMTSDLRGGRLDVVDLFERDIPEVLVSRHEEWLDVAVLNTEDLPRQRRLDLAAVLGDARADSLYADFWTGRAVTMEAGIADFGFGAGARVRTDPDTSVTGRPGADQRTQRHGEFYLDLFKSRPYGSDPSFSAGHDGGRTNRELGLMWKPDQIRRRAERGVTLMEMALASAATAGLLVTVTTSVDAMEPSADAASCQYEKRLILNSIELAHADDAHSVYPAPAGDDGLDQVRSAGWMATEAHFWVYMGLDDEGHPSVVLKAPVDGCE